MRRIIMWFATTVVGLVLLFSYRTSTNSGVSAATLAEESADTGDALTTGGGTAGADTGTDAGGGSGSSGGTTYTGSVASTRWGNVQVAITIVDGRIVDVVVPVYPRANGRDLQINARALPILKQEVLQAQSADIDTVSGATVTSEGYIRSLQAAIDAAHLR